MAGQTLVEFYTFIQKTIATCAFEKVKDPRDMVVRMDLSNGLCSVEDGKRHLEKRICTELMLSRLLKLSRESAIKVRK